MGKGGGTIGYHYLCALLFGIGRGPSNALTHIRVGDKLAWEGESFDDASEVINQPDLFGGEKEEGGIQGIFRSFQGFRDQVLPGATARVIGTTGPYKSGVLPELRSTISTADDVPMFRGRHMFWYDGLVSSMNPYIKEWKFRRWRTTAGWLNDEPWYPEKATIYLKDGLIRAMNPAHIIYQLITDPSQGRGRSPSELDENSFIYSANLFCAEMFGLCFNWQRREEISDFMQLVLDHAGAVVYLDRETGLIVLKPLRFDYDPDDLPHFGPDSGLLSISEDDVGSSSQIFDEVIVEGSDPINDEAIQGRAHNLATRHFRNGSSSDQQNYIGLPTVDLCNRVAERDRNVGAAGLRKFTVKLDRSGFRIHPGAVFKISYPPRGLAGIVLRAGEIDDGDMINGEITIRAVQDVFSLPLTVLVKPTENTWVPPSTEAEPAIAELYEASYRDAAIRLSEADLDTIDEDSAVPAVVARQPGVTSLSYDLITRADGETSYTEGTPAFFTASATLNADISATDTTFVVSNDKGFPEDMEGMALMIGGEYMRIDGYNKLTKVFTVERGGVDTWPRTHTSGDYVWIVDDDIGVSEREYLAGETVEAKVLTRTTSALLSAADADELSIELIGRVFRPFPPADVEIDGVSIYGAVGNTAEPELTFVERNRVTQHDQVIGFFEPSVAAEDGTTHEIDIIGYDHTTVINTYVITSPWIYETADQVADGFSGGGSLFGKLYAVRDGVRSIEQQEFMLRYDPGYGMDYGNNYGGDPAY